MPVRRLELPYQLRRPTVGGVLGQHPFSRSGADPRQLAITQRECGEDVLGRAYDQNLAAREKKVIDPSPPIAEVGRGETTRLKQAPRRAPAASGHCRARDVQR